MLMQMAWSDARPEWEGVLGGEPHTVGLLHMNNFSVVEELPQHHIHVDQPSQHEVPSHHVALLATT